MRAEFDVTIATPLSVGWYDPNIVDRRFYIRPTSVKGIWRWWARAFALGALFEAGCPDLKAASDLVAKWGFGTTRSASEYRITVEVRRPPEVKTVRRRQRSGIQRLDLVALSRDVEYAVGGHFVLRVEGRGQYFDHALRILAVALTLSGVGKGSRKSLGVLDITAARGDAPREQGVRDLIEAVKREAARDAACTGRAQGAELPPAPAVARGVFEVYAVTKDAFEGGSAREAFLEVHNIFLRTVRASAVSSSSDPMDHMAWFFGLPRSQQMKVKKLKCFAKYVENYFKHKGVNVKVAYDEMSDIVLINDVEVTNNGIRGKGALAEEVRKLFEKFMSEFQEYIKQDNIITGYILPSKSDITRRASAVFIASHGPNHLYGGETYLSLFLSNDWPTTLMWLGCGEKQLIHITPSEVKKARDIFITSFVKKRWKNIKEIWP